MKLRPGVKIKIYGDPRIGAQISVRVFSGNLPDVASSSVDVPWPLLIRAGKVLDLTPYLKGPNWEGDARWGDTFLPGALDIWRVDGRVGGLPAAYACFPHLVFFYNRAMFRAHGWTEPRTWDQFFALCDRIQAAGIAPLSMPGVSWAYANTILCAACYNLHGGRRGGGPSNSLAARRAPRSPVYPGGGDGAARDGGRHADARVAGRDLARGGAGLLAGPGGDDHLRFWVRSTRWRARSRRTSNWRR